MTRKCFLTDGYGHWFAVEVDRRGFFIKTLDESEDKEDYSDFENEFGDCYLNRHISSYSFEDLREE